jgi:hypothetical protein
MRGTPIGLAAHGIALFLCIPLVLVLFVRQPLGPGWSVGLGLVIMFGHRFVAAPWMAKFADVRCLWCGRVASPGARVGLTVTAAGQAWAMSACSPGHAQEVGRFLRFLDRYRILIAAGIFAPLVALLADSLAAAAGHRWLPPGAGVLQFRLIVAITVVSTSVAYLGGAPEAGSPPTPLRCPFPLHNLFLLGIGTTLWVFRLVGAWWLIDGAVRLWR